MRRICKLYITSVIFQPFVLMIVAIMYSQCILSTVVSILTTATFSSAFFSNLTANDYVLIAQARNITRINLSTGHVEPLLIANLSSVRAIEYDIINGCVFWYDGDHNIIGRQCHDRVEVLASVDIRSVISMAYDWMAELLYFIDDYRQVIDVIKTSVRASRTLNRWQRTIRSLDQNALTRGLVVHPARGYLFWAETINIQRCDADGGNDRTIVTEAMVTMVTAIAIDYSTDRIYWLDSQRESVGSCDLNGHDCSETQAKMSLRNAFGFAVFKNYVFWSDVDGQNVLVAQKGMATKF